MTRLKINRALPWQWLLPFLFFCIGLVYIYVSPHFESPDSIQHTGVIKWIAEHGGALPVMSPNNDNLHDHEAGQPPLYYLLMTPIWLVTDTSDFAEYFQPNPLVIAGNPSRLGNRNQIFYRQPHPPNLSGTSLALYIVRLITLCMGTISVVAIYQAARTFRHDSTGFAVLSTALAAFNPQFLYISTSVSNDSLVTMLISIIIWQLLVTLRDGFETRRSVLLAVLISLATLSKLSGLTMVLVIALSGVWLAIRRRDLKGLVILAGSMLSVWLLIASWWFWRNLNLYQDLFGAGTHADYHGGRTTTLTRLLIEEFEGFRLSYWGLFGWFSNFTNEIHYLAMDVLTAAALVGLAVFLVKNHKRTFQLTVFCVLGITTVVGIVMVIWYTMQTTASQGRLIFPYISAISMLLALGLSMLKIPTLLIALPMFLFSAYAPFAYIIPRYDHPPIVEDLPERAVYTFARWDDITLIGHEAPAPQRWSPGDEIPITLYWRPLAQTETPHSLFIVLIGSRGDAYATIDSFPGWGSLPTTWWKADAIYRDEYILQIPDDASAFTSVQLQIGWYAYPDGSNIRPLLENGEVASTYFIPIGALVSPPEDTDLPSDAVADGTRFGEFIELAAFRFLDGNVLELHWRLLSHLSGDWRVIAIAFEELFQAGEDFNVLLQKDSVPDVPVGYLKAGERFTTVHAFDVTAEEAGKHRVYVGWYNFDSGERLAVPFHENMLPLPPFAFTTPST